MTIEQLREHIEEVVNYTITAEVRDAKIQIEEGNIPDIVHGHHIVHHVLALADFLGWDTSHDRDEIATTRSPL